MALDWEAIRTEYVTTDASQSELARKYGVKRSTIGERCRKQKWVEQRGKYRSSVVQKAVESRAHEDAKQLAALIDAAEKITGIAVDVLSKPEQLYTYQVERKERYSVPIDSETGDVWLGEESDGVPISERQWSEDRVSDAINTRALKDLAQIVRDMTGLIRDFYDIPTAAQREQREQARQKAEIEKKRAEKDEAGGSITIIVPQDAEGLDA